MAFIPLMMAAIPSWVGTVASIASTAVAAISASNANKYNAAMNEQRARQSLQVAGQREEQQRRTARLEGGERRAAIAQSGTGLGGSNADVNRQSEIFAELDALNIRYEGASESVGYMNQARLDRQQAKSALYKGAIGMATTALTSKW